MNTEELKAKTIALIDSLKSTTGAYGLANGGNEYKIITEIFLYKFFNDKFAFEAKNQKTPYKKRLSKAEKWDVEYDTFTDEEVEDLFSYMGGGIPLIKPHQTLSHLYNASTQGDFSMFKTASNIFVSKIFKSIFNFFAFSFIKFLFSSLYPGSIEINITSKLKSLYFFNSVKSLAIKNESFPPETQQAITSFFFTNSYFFIAFVNFDIISFLKFFLILNSIFSLTLFFCTISPI